MGRQQHGEAVALGEASNRVENPHLVAKVEACSRLVEDQNPRFLSQRPGYQGELALAAADPYPLAPGERLDPQRCKSLSRHLAIGG